MEVVASNYTRSLPLKTGWVLVVKAVITAAMYLTVVLLVKVMIALAAKVPPVMLLAFGLSGTPPHARTGN